MFKSRMKKSVEADMVRFQVSSKIAVNVVAWDGVFLSIVRVRVAARRSLIIRLCKY